MGCYKIKCRPKEQIIEENNYVVYCNLFSQNTVFRRHLHHYGIVVNPCIYYANELKFWNLVYNHIINNCCKFGKDTLIID